MLKPSKRSYPAEIDSLTSLRFFAAFYILIFHMQVFTPLKGEAFWHPLVEQGGIAVDFFFVLSGFILTHVYLPGALKGSYKARDFIVKRFARIYPVHFVTLLLAAGVFALAQFLNYEMEDNERSWLSFFINMFFLQAWGFEDWHSYNRPSWSISAEWFAYVIFGLTLPGMAAYVKKNPAVNSMLMLFYALGGFFLMWSIGVHVFRRELTSLSYDFGIIRILPEFFLGVALYFFGKHYEVDKPKGVVFLGLLAAFFALLWVRVPDVFSVMLCGAIIFYAGELEKAKIKNILNAKSLIYLGHISFSMYMVHWPLWLFTFMTMDRMGLLKHHVLIWAGLLVATHLLAAIFYHVVETLARRGITKALVKN